MKSLRHSAFEIFHELIELAPDDRPPAEQTLCGDDTRLRREVRSLLQAHVTPRGILEECPLEGQVRSFDPAVALGTADHLLEECIGPYRLVREIGSGGMGNVYLARRTECDFEQQVAVKLIRRGMDSDNVLERFRRERQMLAGLQHPNIAGMLDAGFTSDGRPYLVMEYVDGCQIDAYCNDHDLSLTQRLDLFVEVCAAVHHAHQNLIIHRDLKPGNILVTPDGVPKLLDFGIARVLEPSGSPTDVTVTQERRFSPMFASPEQALGRQLTTATDVYSLGVLLHKLVTDSSPYDIAGSGTSDYARVICESKPRRPSDIAATGPSARHWHRRLRGDLDTIILMCLRKEPERRYTSVERLARDIRLHRRGFPVTARPDRFSYRAAKFVRRNKALAGAVCGITLALFGGLAAASYGLADASRQRAAAEDARRDAEAIVSFLTGTLGAADPMRDGRDVTVCEAIDRASRTLARDFADRPLLQATLRHTVGSTYLSLGALEEATAHLAASMDIRSEHLGPAHPDTLDVASLLGQLYWRLGRYDDALVLATNTLERRRRTHGERDAATLASMNELGIVLRALGRPEEAVRHHERALAGRRAMLGEKHYETTLSMNDLAVAYQDLDRFEEAETLLRGALAYRREVQGEDHPATATSMNNLAMLMTHLRRYDIAEPLLVEALELRRALQGEDHPETLNVMSSLALVYRHQGALERSEHLYLKTLAIHRRTLPPNHPDRLSSMNNLGQLYRVKGPVRNAVAILEETVEGCRAAFGREHSDTLKAQMNLVVAYGEQERHHRAERLAGEVIEIARRTRGSDHWVVGVYLMARGRSLKALQSYNEAESVLEESHRILQTALGPDDTRVLNVVKELAELRDESGGREGQFQPGHPPT